jgi:2-polyprenyl-3-methyl-5-hydroxy-6-metoxy-1,4-benzoquinol methylase
MEIRKLERCLRILGLVPYAFSFYERCAAVSPELRKRHATFQSPDGLPVPPLRLIMKVAGTPEPEIYFQGGERAAQSISDILARHHIGIEHVTSILDFGCGCGRVLRQWKHLRSAEIHGTDYNRSLTRWCSRHLKFVTIGKNRLHPPTQYPDSRFDFVYALSVLTHQPERMQIAWMNEFRRILRPSGILLLSLHGPSYLASLNGRERELFLGGHVVTRYPRSKGTNLCCAFHPEVYVRNVLSQGFDVLDWVPEGALGNTHQDAWLLRKC